MPFVGKLLPNCSPGLQLHTAVDYGASLLHWCSWWRSHGQQFVALFPWQQCYFTRFVCSSRLSTGVAACVKAHNLLSPCARDKPHAWEHHQAAEKALPAKLAAIAVMACVTPEFLARLGMDTSYLYACCSTFQIM